MRAGHWALDDGVVAAITDNRWSDRWAPAIAAAAAAFVVAVSGVRGADYPAHHVRALMWDRFGATVWNNLWYAGHATPSYSVLAAPLMALVGPFAVAALGSVVATLVFTRLTLDLACSVADRDVLLVEDIVDSGLTATYLVEQLAARGARSVALCALLHKPARQVKPVDIAYLGFTIPDVFVVGYGMDVAHAYRQLPFVGVIEKS